MQNVGVKQDKLEDVYKQLTSAEVFYDLLNRGKIRTDDDAIIIKI